MNEKIKSLAIKLGIDIQDIETLEQLDALLKQARKDLELIEDKSSEAFKELNKVVTQAEQSLKQATNATKQFADATEELNEGVKAAGKSAEKLADEQVKIEQSAGLAGATLASLGQGIGDIRYGFGAVANNISQVGSLMATLVAQTGSVSLAFKALGAAFKGPLGILVLFQGAIALIDTLAARTKKADDATKELTGGMTAEIATLKLLNQVVQDNTLSSETRNKALDQIKKILPELEKLELNNKDAIDKLNIAVERNIELQVIRARQSKFLDELIEKENALLDIQEQASEGASKGLLSDDPNIRANAERQLEILNQGIAATDEELKLKEEIEKIQQKIYDLKLKEIGLIPEGGSDKAADKKLKEKYGLLDEDTEELLDEQDQRDYDRLIEQQKAIYDANQERLKDEEEFNAEYEKVIDDRIDKDRKYNKMLRQMEQERKQLTIDFGMALLDLAISLSDRKQAASKRDFERTKALLTAEALLSTFFSAQKAYQAVIATAALGDATAPARAALSAAIATAQGLSRVAAIQNTQYNSTGGGYGSTSSGGSDFSGVPREVASARIDLDQGRPLKVFVSETDIRETASNISYYWDRATLTE